MLVSMTDDLTPDTPDSGAGGAETSESPDPANATTTNREWIIPAAGLGALLLAVVVFASGFAVGRATDDTDPIDSASHVVVRVDPRSEAPRGFGFQDFGQRGPQGRFNDPQERPFDNLDMLRGAALERLCGFLEDGMIPQDAPFVDRLTELCDSTNA